MFSRNESAPLTRSTFATQYATVPLRRFSLGLRELIAPRTVRSVHDKQRRPARNIGSKTKTTNNNINWSSCKLVPSSMPAELKFRPPVCLLRWFSLLNILIRFSCTYKCNITACIVYCWCIAQRNMFSFCTEIHRIVSPVFIHECSNGLVYTKIIIFRKNPPTEYTLCWFRVLVIFFILFLIIKRGRPNTLINRTNIEKWDSIYWTRCMSKHQVGINWIAQICVSRQLHCGWHNQNSISKN